jgi:hypothetical protein
MTVPESPLFAEHEALHEIVLRCLASRKAIEVREPAGRPALPTEISTLTDRAALLRSTVDALRATS